MIVPITAQMHREWKWHIAFCPEFPEANGLGETREASIANLKESIHLLLEDRREDARQNLPEGSELVEIT